MTTELMVIEALKTTIEEHINEFLDDDRLLCPIGEDNVVIDFPDTDNMPKSTMVYLQPNYGEMEELSWGTNTCELDISLFILCKRDRNENLTKKVFGYFKALQIALFKNQALGGIADLTRVQSYDYYPMVEGNKGCAGVEAVIKVLYEKDYRQ